MKIQKTKEELENTKIIRQFGIADLKKYQQKIKQNIEVFEDAIKKEKTEFKRVQGMIEVLEDDIKEVEILKKKIR